MVAVGDKVKYRCDGEIAPIIAVGDGGEVEVKTKHWGICGEVIGESVDLLTVEGPVHTVTRQEIIPGTYDGVTVRTPNDDIVNLHISYLAHDPSPDELERAAAVLTAIAGALRDA